jgi:Uma2 family endonuclease
MATTIRWTIADLEALPQDGKLYEIIEGELLMSKNPVPQHQQSCNQICFELGKWNEKTQVGIVFPFTALLFADDDYVVPDAFWVSNERLKKAYDKSDGKFHYAPELVIEVLSPGSANIERDRDIKLKLYSRRGVSEYWIVDWQRRQIEIYRRQQTQPHLVATLSETDNLESPLLEGFSCAVSSLFAGLLPID